MELDDRRAAQLRGRGPVGTLAIVVIFLAGNVAVAGFLIPLGAPPGLEVVATAMFG